MDPSWLHSHWAGVSLLSPVWRLTQLTPSEDEWWWLLEPVRLVFISQVNITNILRCPLQILLGLRHADHEDWRIHVNDERSRSQRSPRYCRCSCYLWRRRGQKPVHQNEKQINIRFYMKSSCFNKLLTVKMRLRIENLLEKYSINGKI